MRTKRSTAVDSAVGARIRNLRLRKGLSQTDVGKQVGVTFQQVQKYENGSNRVSAGRLAQLSKLFGVTISAFYSEVVAQGEKAIGRPKLTSLGDANIDRLVSAFETLKDKNLKAAILQVAKEMVRGQRRK